MVNNKNNFSIKEVKARQVYDSRGRPTVEATIMLESGIVGSAIAPSGASVGTMEAVELRDSKQNLVGNVHGAVKNVNTKINQNLVGIDVRCQTQIDETMIMLDGTRNKSVLGSNAILPVSLAAAKAASCAINTTLFCYLGGLNATVLPVPMMNFINGGMHADNMLDIQEFMIMPVGVDSITEAIEIGSEVLAVLKEVLKVKGLSTNTGDEGGFAIAVNLAENALDLIVIAIEKAGYKPGRDVLMALDVAASELYQNGLYHFKGEDKQMKKEELISYYRNLMHNYPIFSIEDPFAENDIDGLQGITKSLGSAVQIVGDDVFATNADLLQDGIKKGICNSIIIKPNQIGTITEMLDTIRLAKLHGYHPIISHRSGETEDVSIAHMAVGFGTYQIKAGCLARTDRVAKYNELIRIEEQLGRMGMYAGSEILRRYAEFRKNNA